MSVSAASPGKSSRIDSIDALRGSALLGLFLLHAVEHFEFSVYPPDAPAWLATLNKQTTAIAYFLFGGKAYAIFAMMFGVSFFIIIDRAAQRGVDFRGRFLWRLCVLAISGYLFGLLYCGEILSMLAILGLPLVFLYKTPTRLLVSLSALLLLQIPFLWQLAMTLIEPGYAPLKLGVGGFYRKLYPVFEHGGLWEVCKVNTWTGVLARYSWSIENGRYLQMCGLFIWGLLLGRSRIFENPQALARLAWRTFIIGGVAFAALYLAQTSLSSWGLPKVQQGILKKLFSSYANLAQMTVWAGGFVLLYQLTRAGKTLALLIPFGRTSLTCYVVQNAIGVVLFYHFGAGLFRQWGQFYSVLYGIVFFALQLPVMHLWLRHFHYGPFEWLWRSLTMLSFKTPFRKRAATPALAPIATA